MTKREQFLLLAKSKVGAFYRFGSKGPDRFDCSGLVTWALYAAGGPDWREDHSAAGLAKAVGGPQQGSTPADGDLAFYGRDKENVDHVMIVTGDRVFGACGGDHTTTSDTAAAAASACVQYRSSFAYRADFLGFGSLADVLV